MSKIKFSDGIEFQTDGPLRPIKKPDGWYVVGQGILIPVDSLAEAEAFIDKHKKIKTKEQS